MWGVKLKRCRTKNRYGDDWLAFVILIGAALLALILAAPHL